MKPVQIYDSIDNAYAYFNKVLFEGSLPSCLITMQRRKGARGYYANKRFAKLDTQEVTDEIALNPASFGGRTPQSILSTLVHEMCHLWQSHYGKPSRSSYHNKEWADKMNAIGLIPSDSGQPGGKQTGQSLSHYVDVNGAFDRACKRYLNAHGSILYRDVQTDTEKQEKKAASKTKYTCPKCGLHAWAKPDVSLACVDCGAMLQA